MRFRQLFSCSVLLAGVLLLSAPARAIDPRSVPEEVDVRIPLPQLVSDPLRLQLERLALEPARVLEWLKDIKRVPLRPVRIGEAPRRPNDPEPGLGVVLKIPF
jgi:hypothetical protein